MNVMEAIKRRRSVRNYKPDPIPDEVLERLLNALRLAPSGRNAQAWKFIVVRDADTRRRLAAACSFQRRPEGQPFVADAPVVVVACGSEADAACGYRKDGELYITYGREAPREGITDRWSCLPVDLAIAMDHLSLAAMEKGLGTCWVAGLDELKVKKLLGIPADMRAPLLMPVGYPAAWPEARPRKPLGEVVCHERYR
jgi:nitroreductase